MPELGFRDPNNVCGSIRGYDRHCYHHERPCAACNRAKAVTKTLSGVRSGRATRLHVPYVLLAELLEHAPPELVAAAEEMLRPGAVQAAQLALELATQEDPQEDAA